MSEVEPLEYMIYTTNEPTVASDTLPPIGTMIHGEWLLSESIEFVDQHGNKVELPD